MLLDDDDIVGSASPITSTSNDKGIKPQTVIIADKKELYKCYMPFISGGGLFFTFNEETVNKVQPGDKVLILFSMLEDKRKTPISGTVIWVNKSGLHRGYGVSFANNASHKSLKESIEAQIVELGIRKEPTYTL